jgi:hypothetical protein
MVPSPLTPLPDMAREISGKTVVFERNPTAMETAVLEFTTTAEATMRFTKFGSEQVVSVPIGLDGVYRMSVGAHDLPQGYRGCWADPQTFLLEYDNIANNDHATIQVRFEGERMLMSVQETAHERGTQFEGHLQEP